jgi:anti-sigma factor RsiW
MSPCASREAIRDYAFDELPAPERREMERHIAACTTCAAELDNLRITTAVLRAVPDREIPQRISFVAEPLPERTSWWAAFWNSGPRLGFAGAGMLALAITFSALHQPTAVKPTVIQTASGVDVSKEIDKAVTTAVNQAVAKVRSEDAEMTRVALEAAEKRHVAEHRALVASFEDGMTVMEKRLGVATLASMEQPGGMGAGQ